MLKLLSIFLLLPALAGASMITLTNPNQVGTPGGLLTFNVNVSNVGGSGDLFLNGDSFTVDAPLTLNDLFFTNAPVSVAAGSSSTFTLFTIQLPAVISPNTYLGSYTILGGVDDQDQSVLGSPSFSVAVRATQATAPEPSTLLLAAPLLLLCFIKRRQVP